MTSSVVLQNMLDGNTVDYDQEQMSKITTEIEFYIKEELQEYFDGYVKLRRKRC
jgi:flagellar basal body rod protein FlgB